MPDGYSAPSRSQALSSIGAGLLDTYFPRLAQERDRADNEKRYDQQLRLQALHSLMESGRLPVADVPNVMAMWAKEAKIHNDPGIQEAIDHMKKAATEQVPYGREQETAGSLNARMSGQVAAANEQNRPGVDLNANAPLMRPVPTLVPQPPRAGDAPPPETQMVTPRTVPQEPMVVTAPALKVVPPEPVMFQPTRAVGELTQDEYADLRKTNFYNAQQEAMLKRQSQLAEEAGDRQAKRDSDRQLAQIAQIRTRAEEARKTQDELFTNKIKMLDPEVQAKAKLRVAQIETALTAQNQNPNVTPEEIHRQAGQMALAEVQIGIAQKQAQIDKSKAEIGHWKNIDARALVGKGGAATQGMTAGQARIFRVNTLDILPDLNATRSQLLKLQNDLALLGGKDPAIEARIKELSAQQDGLLLRLKEERDKILGQVQVAPSTSQQSGQSPAGRKPLGGPLGLP